MANPYHNPPGPGGGQFASKGAAGGGSDSLNPRAPTARSDRAKFAASSRQLRKLETKVYRLNEAVRELKTNERRFGSSAANKAAQEEFAKKAARAAAKLAKHEEAHRKLQDAVRPFMSYPGSYLPTKR